MISRIQSVLFGLLCGLIIGLLPIADAYAASTTPIVYTARVLGTPERTRLIVEYDRAVKIVAYLLDDPQRVVIDMPATLFSLPKSLPVPDASLVSAVRYGSVSNLQARMVLDLTASAKLETTVLKDISGTARHRLVLDIVAVDDATFATLVRKAAPEPVIKPVVPSRRRYTVMLDPGHGGIDGGASASKSIEEKDITLAFVKKLTALLEEDGQIDVKSTRDVDRFLSLSDRLEAVRASHADLFVSVHADSLGQRSIRGATVYTLSREGSDTLSRLLAQKQNRADMVAGLELPEVPTGATDILIDLTRRETESFSQAFADELVTAMGKVTRLINNPHRSADFYVLKAPEVPSVLLELGYLSNQRDQSQLVDPKWQEKAARSVRDAIVRFLRPSLTGQEG